MDEFKDLLLILLGSLLAILSPGLIDWIRRAHARKPIKRAIELELAELRYTMGALAYRLHSHLGTLNHSFLEWQETIERNYEGPDGSPETAIAIREMLRSSPAELETAQRMRAAMNKSLTLKEYRLPFVTSQLSVLHDFSVDFQQRVLQIHTQLELLNGDVPYLMHQHDLTFTSLSAENHAIVEGNIKSGYATIARRAEDIAKRVSQLLPP